MAPGRLRAAAAAAAAAVSHRSRRRRRRFPSIAPLQTPFREICAGRPAAVIGPLGRPYQSLVIRVLPT